MFARVITTLDRRMTALRRRNSQLRHMIPLSVVRRARGLQGMLHPLRDFIVPPLTRSPHDNVFHCSIQKTGSQWIRSLLTDFRTYQYTGLRPWDYRHGRGDPRPLLDRRFESPFPKRTLISPLYVTFENFQAIPRSGSYRAFFIVRDPRDVIVSWYYSARFSHLVVPDPAKPLTAARAALDTLSEAEGLHYAVEYAERMGRFATLRSWVGAPARDPAVTLVRFEDLVGADSFGEFRRLFDFLDIAMSDRELETLLEAYSFERLSGRKKGTENVRSHLRSGSSGGWRSKFDDALTDHFRDVTGNLVEELGYTW